MTVAEARTEIEMFTRSSSFPTLDTSEVTLLLNKAKRASQPFAAGVLTGEPQNNNIMLVRRQGTVPPDTFADWQSAHAYVVGNIVVPTTRNGHYYTCIDPGTSGSSEPTFDTDTDDTTTDGGVVWQESGAALWVPTFFLPGAIARGWKLKASKCAGNYDFKSDDQMFNRSQVYKACLDMAAQWNRVGGETLELQGSLRERRIAGIPTGNNDWLWNDDDTPLSSVGGVAVYNVGGGRTVWTDDF